MKLGVQGILTIVEHRLDRHVSVEEAEALARAGADVRVRHVRNHIADTGLDALAALVGGGYGSPMVGAHTYTPDTVAAIDAVSPSGAFVGEMRLGTLTLPPEPTDADTGLAGPTAYSVRASLTEPRLLVSNTEDEVRFSCFLPAGFLSGQTITEEGIFTFDGDLFARIALDTPEVLGDTYGVQFIHRVRFATFLTLTPPPVLLAGTIDINPDILGGINSGRTLAGIIDVSPDIEGSMEHTRIWAPTDRLRMRLQTVTAGGAAQPRMVVWAGSTSHARLPCPNTGPWQGYASVVISQAGQAVIDIHIGAMIHSGGFVFDSPLEIQCLAAVSPPSANTNNTLTAEPIGWPEPDLSQFVSQSLPTWTGDCSPSAHLLLATFTLTPLGKLSVSVP